jgi:hypothetical protein
MPTIKSKKIIPQDYLECLIEKGKAFTLQQHHERALANALGVAPVDLPEAIDRMRSDVHDVQLAIMYGNFLKAELQLDEAIQLYEKAAEIHYNYSIKEMDE